MPDFIKLTEASTFNDIYVRSFFIFSINSEGDYTAIISHGDALLNVKETPEEILSLIYPKTTIVAGD